jgi:YHS domain-containing protein
MWHVFCFNKYGKTNPYHGGAAMQKQQSSSKVHIDPVCAMEVSAGNADIKSTHQSHTYYFCAEGCKKAFESAPDKYLASKPGKKKGWWGRHVDRLKNLNCDRSMECHY